MAENAEGLTLCVVTNKSKTGYFGVRVRNPGKPKPYQAEVTCGGKSASLGSFASPTPRSRGGAGGTAWSEGGGGEGHAAGSGHGCSARVT